MRFRNVSVYRFTTIQEIKNLIGFSYFFITDGIYGRANVTHKTSNYDKSSSFLSHFRENTAVGYIFPTWLQ